MVVRSLHLSSLTCNRGTHFKQQHIYSTMKTLLRCMALQPPRFQEVAERLASNQTPCPLSPFKLAPGTRFVHVRASTHAISAMRYRYGRADPLSVKTAGRCSFLHTA
eukprot:6214247-Pleurochrysis_carterae.AAC.2